MVYGHIERAWNYQINFFFIFTFTGRFDLRRLKIWINKFWNLKRPTVTKRDQMQQILKWSYYLQHFLIFTCIALAQPVRELKIIKIHFHSWTQRLPHHVTESKKIFFNRKQFIKLKSIYHCQQYNDRYVCIIEVDNKNSVFFFLFPTP